jgi:hypothetical protein
MLLSTLQGPSGSLMARTGCWSALAEATCVVVETPCLLPVLSFACSCLQMEICLPAAPTG